MFDCVMTFQFNAIKHQSYLFLFTRIDLLYFSGHNILWRTNSSI